jgi:hypothetical protein
VFIISCMLTKWTRDPGKLAAYIGRTGSARRDMLIVAEAIGGRFIVDAIRHCGVVVLLTANADSLREPQPDLFA